MKRRQSRRTGCLLLIAITGLALLVGLYAAQQRSYGAPLNRVATWMPTSWDAERARASWSAHRAQIQELSPVWYQAAYSGDGSIVPYAGACDAALVAEAHANHTLVLPLINNSYDGGFDPAPVSAIIHDPARRAVHVTALVNEVLACGYDGIDLDYESLNGEADREAFSLFVEQLAAALHAQGKLLAVTVHPKTAEPGTWDGPQAQDWARLGAAADRLRIMTYGYHWSGSEPGPLAPVFWMDDVAAFAVRQVNPSRVYLGLHFYGLDWANGTASGVTWERVQELLVASGAVRQWSGESGGAVIAEPWFVYDDGGTEHEIWYADGESIAARLSLVRQYGLGGVAVWRLGGEDPANWQAIAAALHPSSRLYLPVVER